MQSENVLLSGDTLNITLCKILVQKPYEFLCKLNVKMDLWPKKHQFETGNRMVSERRFCKVKMCSWRGLRSIFHFAKSLFRNHMISCAKWRSKWIFDPKIIHLRQEIIWFLSVDFAKWKCVPGGGYAQYSTLQNRCSETIWFPVPNGGQNGLLTQKSYIWDRKSFGFWTSILQSENLLLPGATLNISLCKIVKIAVQKP